MLYKVSVGLEQREGEVQIYHCICSLVPKRSKGSPVLGGRRWRLTPGSRAARSPASALPDG